MVTEEAKQEEEQRFGTGGVLLDFPSKAISVQADGKVLIDLDAIEGSILAMDLPDMAKFMADDIPLLRDVLKALDFRVIQFLEKKELGKVGVPMGDGRKLIVKRTPSYDKPLENLKVLKAKLEGMGFKEEVDFPRLFWKETIEATEAKEVDCTADAATIRKALILSGQLDEEKQNVELGRHEGNPSLKVEGKVKGKEAAKRIKEAGKAIAEKPADPFAR